MMLTAVRVVALIGIVLTLVFCPLDWKTLLLVVVVLLSLFGWRGSPEEL